MSDANARAVPPLAVMTAGVGIQVAGLAAQVSGWEAGFMVFILGAGVALVGLLALVFRRY